MRARGGSHHWKWEQVAGLEEAQQQVKKRDLETNSPTQDGIVNICVSLQSSLEWRQRKEEVRMTS